MALRAADQCGRVRRQVLDFAVCDREVRIHAVQEIRRRGVRAHRRQGWSGASVQKIESAEIGDRPRIPVLLSRARAFSSRAALSVASRSRMRSIAAIFSSQLNERACSRHAALARATCCSKIAGSSVSTDIVSPALLQTVRLDQLSEVRRRDATCIEHGIHTLIVLGAAGLQRDGA